MLRRLLLAPTTIRLLRRMLPARLLAWVRAIRRVRADYRHGHKANPSLLRPRNFNEKIQWRKLFDLDPRLAVLSDKLAARGFIAERVGAHYLPPLLWQGARPDDAPLETLPRPYVLKPNHGSGPHLMVEPDDAPDWVAVRADAAAWLAHCHGSQHCEPAYVHIPRRLLAERRLRAADGDDPVEYRCFCFDGRVALILTTQRNAAGRPRVLGFHDRDWQRVYLRLVSPIDPQVFPRPARLDEMLSVAERLAAGFGHMRVDLFDCGDAVFVGELTAYCFSGSYAFHPPELGLWLGGLWRIRFPASRAIWAVAFRRYEIRPPAAASPAIAAAPSDALA